MCVFAKSVSLLSDDLLQDLYFVLCVVSFCQTTNETNCLVKKKKIKKGLMHCKLDVLLSVFQQSIHVIRENGGCKHALKSIARQQKRTLRERKKKNGF